MNTQQPLIFWAAVRGAPGLYTRVKGLLKGGDDLQDSNDRLLAENGKLCDANAELEEENDRLKAEIETLEATAIENEGGVFVFSGQVGAVEEITRLRAELGEAVIKVGELKRLKLTMQSAYDQIVETPSGRIRSLKANNLMNGLKEIMNPPAADEWCSDFNDVPQDESTILLRRIKTNGVYLANWGDELGEWTVDSLATTYKESELVLNFDEWALVNIPDPPEKCGHAVTDEAGECNDCGKAVDDSIPAGDGYCEHGVAGPMR